MRNRRVRLWKEYVSALFKPSGGATGGQIFFEGVDITDAKTDINKHRQKMGMVFQQFNLFPHMTIMDNLTLAPIKLQGKKKEEIEPEAMKLLERVGLADRANAYPSQLSGGQKQRIAIVRALCMKPDVMLFDEPPLPGSGDGRRGSGSYEGSGGREDDHGGW